jgi:hypothetical protein
MSRSFHGTETEVDKDDRLSDVTQADNVIQACDTAGWNPTWPIEAVGLRSQYRRYHCRLCPIPGDDQHI